MNVRARWLVAAAVLIPALAVEVSGDAIAGAAQEPGLAPYQQTVSALNLGVGGALIFRKVPSGQRLVLKEVNCQVVLGPNSAPLNQQAVLVLSNSLALPFPIDAHFQNSFFNSSASVPFA